METLRYNGKNVYTQSNTSVTNDDLAKAKVEEGVLGNVYFFEVDPERRVRKIGFDKEKIDELSSGLNVESNIGFGTAVVSIAGLERILGFLVESGCVGKNLSYLKNRKVTTYNRGMHLLGISLK